MAILKPFKSLRPAPEYVADVAALPYDVMNTHEARKMVEDNPYSFLHINRAEIDLEPSINIHDALVYERARDNLNKMINDGILTKDNTDYYYIYKQEVDDRAQTGLVACTSIDDYSSNLIKKHENTMERQEMDRFNYLDYTNANTEPVFMVYRQKDEICEVIKAWMDNNHSLYDFVSEDNVRHTVWKIDDKRIIDDLTSKFKSVQDLYIADGHHLCAASYNVGIKRRKEQPQYNGVEEFNYFLSCLFPHSDLKIMDYNRVIQDLNEFSDSEFLELVKEKFDLVMMEGTDQCKPDRKHVFGMYLDKHWYSLEPKEGIFNPDDPIESLDISILHNNILNPLLGIVDPRIDNRIEFVGGPRGMAELELIVADGMRVAFSIYPASIEELLKIADMDKMMPPKSTYFEPKLRSGLFVHQI